MIGASYVNFKHMSKELVEVFNPFHPIILSSGCLILVEILAMEGRKMPMSS